MAGGALQGTPAEQRSAVMRGMGVVALVVGFYAFMRHAGYLPEAPGPVFALGFLLIVGNVAGQLAAFLRLPRLTGYLLAGMAAGPHGAHIIDHASVASLSLVNALALALIALEAGAELTMAALRSTLRSLLWQTLFHTVLLGGGAALALFLLASFGLIPFLTGLDTLALIAVALVWGTVATSKSPAATLALIKETKARGPVASIGLGVVVLFDVIVLVLFAAVIMLAKSALFPAQELSFDTLSLLGEELVVSVAAGVTFGLGIALFYWIIDKERVLFVVLAAYGITAVCQFFHYDTLLVFAVAGFVVTNLSKQGPKLIHTTEQMGMAVMVVFFATAGAHLDLAVLVEAWPVALALAGARVALTYLSSQLGHRAARDPEPIRRYAFTALISQAGVTIGLATIVAQELGSVGTGLATLIIAVVGINELAGPVIFKLGLARAGEIPAHPLGVDDGSSSTATVPPPGRS